MRSYAPHYYIFALSRYVLEPYRIAKQSPRRARRFILCGCGVTYAACSVVLFCFRLLEGDENLPAGGTGAWAKALYRRRVWATRRCRHFLL